MRKVLKWSGIGIAGLLVFFIGGIALIYIFAVPDEVKEQDRLEREREAAVRAEERALEDARKAEAKKVEEARKAVEEASKAAEEAAKTREAKAETESEGFDSVKDWAKAMCGDKNHVKDSFEDYWKEKRTNTANGYESGKLDDLRSGWIRDVEKDGVVDESDFPAKYRFVARSKGKIFGDRHWMQHERFYNYDCSFYGNAVSNVDFTKVSMP